MEGTLTGTNNIAGGIVTLTRTGPSFQVGTGANAYSALDFGASGWFTTTVKKQPNSGAGFNVNSNNGDFNIKLSGVKLNDTPAQCLTICSGESATFSANGSQGTPPYTYAWNNGAGNAQTVSVSPTSTTTYTVTITDANGCTDTDQVTVTIKPAAECAPVCNVLANITCAADPLKSRTVT